MSTDVTLPELGESVTEGTVTRWLVEVGQSVSTDDPLLEISTDKVDTEIPSPVTGVLLSIAASEDDVVEVGGLLATIGSTREAESGAPGSSDGPVSAGDQPARAGSDRSEPKPAPQVSSYEPEADRGSAPVSSATDPHQPDGAGSGSPGGDAAGFDVTLPELGESVTEGTVTRWLKDVGDSVDADEPLLEISTDKVDTEIPSPVAGTLLSIAAQQDAIVEVGAVLAVVGEAGAVPSQQPATDAPAVEPAPAPDRADAGGQEQAATSSQVSPEAPAESSPPPSTAPADQSSAYVTPLVRKLAKQHEIDLSQVRGTGVGGRIRRGDVLAAAEQAKKKPAAAAAAPSRASGRATAPKRTTPAATTLRGRVEKMTRLRSIIADRMVESLRVSAQLTTVIEVDVTRIAQLRARTKDRFAEREGVKLSFLPFFAKATIEALKVHPTVNSSIDPDEGTVTYYDTENLGVAVDTERGLLVPVIRKAGDLNLAGLARSIADVAERTRTNKVTPDELSGGTFTLTNTGSRGALFDTPIINQPQVAILGTGAVTKRPVVMSGPDGDVIAIRSMMYLAITYDHRIVDGADAARFLATIKQRLEDGAFEGDVGA